MCMFGGAIILGSNRLLGTGVPILLFLLSPLQMTYIDAIDLYTNISLRLEIF